MARDLRLGVWSVSIVTVVALVGCKPTSPTASKSKDDADNAVPANTCDLSYMARESDKGVKDQVACVSSVIDAAGPGWLKAIKSAVELAAMIRDATTTQIELSEAPEDATSTDTSTDSSSDTSTDSTASAGTATDAGSTSADTGGGPAADGGNGDSASLALAGDDDDSESIGQKATMTTWEIINVIFKKGTENPASIRPRWLGRCAQQTAEGSENVFDAVEAIQELAQSQSLSYDSFDNLVTAVTSATSASLNFAQILSNCVPGNNKQALASLNGFVEKLSGGLGAVADAVSGLGALYKCSINITNGAIILGHNTSCLISDLQSLQASSASLKQALNNTLPTDGPSPYAQYCKGNPVGCGTTAMQLFGIYLSRQYAGTFTFRSTFCAQNCGNTGTQNLCQQAAPQIFGDDADSCGAVCTTAQCPNAIDICISYCCSQDSSCASAAQGKVVK